MKTKIRILLAEDDANLGSLLTEYLTAKEFETVWFQDGVSALKGFEPGSFNLCILDIMMPGLDGLSLADSIWRIKKDEPVIFLTAKSQKEDIIEGFRQGADDYITKPFLMEELLYRIHAVLKRTDKTDNEQVYKIGKYTFYVLNQRLVFDDKEEVKLTTKETDLLELLCKHRNNVLERNYALRNIWVDDNYFNARSMDVYITRLRKYFKDDPAVSILNVHGKGYKLCSNLDTAKDK